MSAVLTQLTEDEREELAIIDQLLWRQQSRSSLVEYARNIPIPGVPQSDNYDELKLADEVYELAQSAGSKKEREQAFKFDDGRWDNHTFTPKVETELEQHHILILETNQKIIEGTLIAPDGSICRRGMYMMPPGSAKSTYCSVVTPTWVMGKYPESPLILTSYADMLAKKHGKRARQVCMSPEYKAIFGSSIDPHTKAADQWALLNGSEYLSAGLQSGLTGNRAIGLIWDDPVKGRRAAESQAEQMNTWDAYRDDARTRKVPTAWEIGIMTRWHQKDLGGMILPEEWAGESGFIKGLDGYWWYVLCIQAEAEHSSDPLGRKPGQFLWESWFNTEGDPRAYWEPLKRDSRSWGSLFQQVPTPPEGDFFKQSWVQYYDHLPKDLNKYLSADYAVTQAQDADDPDFTSIGIWGMDSEGALYFITGWHGKVDSAEWTDIALDFVEMHKPLAHIAGGGPIRRGTEPWMKRRMRDRKAFVQLVWYPETFNKAENARSFQAMMSNGMVHWPRGNEEAEWVIRQLTGFGTLRYDDAVDQCSMIGRHVAKMWETRKPKAPKPVPVIEARKIAIANMGAKQLKKK